MTHWVYYCMSGKNYAGPLPGIDEQRNFLRHHSISSRRIRYDTLTDIVEVELSDVDFMEYQLRFGVETGI